MTSLPQLPQGQALSDLLVHLGRAVTTHTLLAGVAHELGNVQQALELTGSAGAEAAPRGDAAAVPRQEWVEHALAGAIAALSATAGSAAADVGPVAIHGLISQVLDWQQYQRLHLDVPVKSQITPHLPAVRAREADLQHVLLALITNAKEAVRDAPESEITLLAAATPRGATLVIEDTGPGVPPGEWERVFEPFYTTKSRARHAGIGLTMCRQLLTPVGGTIALEAPPEGRGTRVVVRLGAWSPAGTGG